MWVVMTPSVDPARGLSGLALPVVPLGQAARVAGRHWGGGFAVWFAVRLAQRQGGSCRREDGGAGARAGACGGADAPAAVARQHAHHAAAGESDSRCATRCYASARWPPCIRPSARTSGACRPGLRGAPFERAADWYEAVRLLQQQPSLATVMDEYGSFALHFAAMHRASPEVVTLLLRLNEGAAKCFNKSKYLPIHYAAGNGAPPECVALIWHAHPAGAEQRNGANQTAMALATQQNRWGVPL